MPASSSFMPCAQDGLNVNRPPAPDKFHRQAGLAGSHTGGVGRLGQRCNGLTDESFGHDQDSTLHPTLRKD